MKFLNNTIGQFAQYPYSYIERASVSALADVFFVGFFL